MFKLIKIVPIITGVRFKNLADGEKLYVLSGERRERGERVAILSEGKTG